MYWQEDIKEEHFTPPNTIQDTAFTIHAKVLPMDHAHLLKQALLHHLPWLKQTSSGIFPIATADGNGWQQSPSALYHPSARSKLTLRIPAQYLPQAHQLVGKTLHLPPYQIKITKSLPPKPLSTTQTLLAKHILTTPTQSEQSLLKSIHTQLQSLHIHPKKLLLGLPKTIQTPTQLLHTRSLLIANLRKSESHTLQSHGIGSHRLLGIGLFLPHKSITPI